MNRTDPSGAGTRVVAKRDKASHRYRDSSDNDVEILGSTQRSGEPRIFQSNASSRPAMRYASAYSARRHMYNYRYDSNAEDGD